jgi:hypothetical protein
MATHAAIGYQNEDGSIYYIYQHHDGGPNGVGHSLFYRFNDETLARLLVESGGLYPAGNGGGVAKTGKPYHKIDRPNVQWFRGREEYTYLWRNGQWHYHFRYQNPKVKWHRLATIMKREGGWLPGPVPQASYSDAARGDLFGN